MVKLASLVVLAGLVSCYANAAECVKTETRVACKTGDVAKDTQIEKTCYEKCDGKPTCDKSKKVGSADACIKWAQSECSVFRPGITDKKKVTVKFDGKILNDGKDLCEPEKAEYKWHQCK
jgi:hypothetical protein